MFIFIVLGSGFKIPSGLQPGWKTVWQFLKKLKIELPYDPAILLLGIYPDKAVLQKDTSTSYIHSSSIYNSQGMEATAVSTDR